MSKQMKRNEVEKTLTWDLDPIFTSDAQWENHFTQCQSEMGIISEKIEKMFDSGKALLDLLETDEKITRQILNLYMYAHLKSDEDTTNTTYQAILSRIYSLYTTYAAYTASITPKLLSKTREEIQLLQEEEVKLALYDTYFNRIFKEKAHILSEKEETLLANATEVLNASGRTASTLMNADLKYPKMINEKGKEVQLTNGLYAKFLESKNRAIRQEAFEKVYSAYDKIKNTLANTLFTNTKKNVFLHQAKNYVSSREMFLSGNEVPESVYDTLLAVVNEHLPLLHRYVDLRAKVLGLDKITAYDMYVPIVEDVDIKYTIDQAKAVTLKALAPLGEEYLSILQKAFDERWIDWIENEGKRGGAYSSGGYDTKPYVLMNWQDSIDQLYTLVHELGHSVHSYYSRATQPFVYSSYPIFLAEIASTTNENLLTEYLLKTETDPKVRAYVINHYLDGVKGTVFRQTQFAEFEYRVHQAVENHQPFTHETFSQLYAEINAKYYGEKMISHNEIQLEWARIPHFYTNFYVFQYATGFAAASALAKKILTGTKEDLDKYISFLKAGCSLTPIQIMQNAGVDMNSKQYLEEALAIFAERLTQLEQLIA